MDRLLAEASQIICDGAVVRSEHSSEDLQSAHSPRLASSDSSPSYTYTVRSPGAEQPRGLHLVRKGSHESPTTSRVLAAAVADSSGPAHSEPLTADDAVLRMRMLRSNAVRAALAGVSVDQARVIPLSVLDRLRKLEDDRASLVSSLQNVMELYRLSARGASGASGMVSPRQGHGGKSEGGVALPAGMSSGSRSSSGVAPVDGGGSAGMSLVPS